MNLPTASMPTLQLRTRPPFAVAYVALGRTEAAKSVQTIPAAKIKTVEKKAQTTLTQLVMKSCPKPAMNLLLSDPKKGLEKR